MTAVHPTPLLGPGAAPGPSGRTARVTGAFYLGMALTGMVGFFLVRPSLLADDAATTLANLQEHELLARTGVALELGLVLFQVLAALWFFRLFRRVDAFAAAAVAVFGVVNGVALMGSAAFLATALEAALGGAGGGEGTPQLMYALSEGFWAVGNLFFGLWLIPMGWCVLRTGTMPRLLGRVLVVGGAGFVLSAFTTHLLPDAEWLTGALVVPATVGEFWILGYLLIRGTGSAAGD